MSDPFRVTQRGASERALQGLQGNLRRLATLQQQLSSGRLISRPSDDPAGTVAAMQLRSEVRVTEQYSRNSLDGLGWLGTTDTALTSSLASLRRVRDLTVQGMSTGSADANAREAMAVEVDKLREGLLALANTTYLGRPVFGGTTAGQAAYDATGAYVGDGGQVNRTVGTGDQVRVDTAGAAAYGSGPGNLFGVLGSIAADLRTNPGALGGDLDRLDAAMSRMQNTLSDVGARYGRVEQTQRLADDRVVTLKGSLSQVENVDLPKTIVDLQLQQVAYQAALGATSKVLQPSLLDFLR
ncbi:MAG: flagellar hook-associated protein FlgL [Actinomycetota bacterium]